MARIAVIDDEQSVCHAFQAFLGDEGHEVAVAATAQRGLALLGDFEPDLVILDIRLPDADGLDVLAQIARAPDPPAVLIITAHGTMDTAVEAMRRGAFEYLTKPIDLDEAKLVIERALQSRQLSHEVARLRRELRGGAPLLVGNSPAMQKVYKTIGAVAPTNATVLIRGESGTGKELAARAIHQAGPRSKGPFVTVDCTALPEHLIESELYGYEAGAFTGAAGAKPGKIEQANGGTLFLDEIGELSAGAQAKLLRFLETRQTERLGSTRTLSLDVRILAATNEDLEAKRRQGAFREDLFYRIHVVTLDLPPLRQRKDDIPLLIAHFLDQIAGGRRLQISQAALDVLVAHDWPGNVRELRNALEHAVIACRGDAILPEHLPRMSAPGPGGPAADLHRAAAALLAAKMAAHPEGTAPLYDLMVEELDRAVIAEALRITGRNQARTAALLGLHRTTLRNKIRQYGL
ncbi:MAG TPA: sigma-54 dependent transcriptional regulator [Planctomycetota bacterium]|nr:sigma-54 dependent transcriptional regulator [Planctomycetota bacterium]HRR79533.1 sigma-54 dependent transcriptional regulator [Planctomycetota bacterium]HRT96141.1 sigma-54 dependent transcriptional regulator [Planctomycetota bacterium]